MTVRELVIKLEKMRELNPQMWDYGVEVAIEDDCSWLHSEANTVDLNVETITTKKCNCCGQWTNCLPEPVTRLRIK